MFYTGPEISALYILGVGACAILILPTLIKWGIKNKKYKEKNITFRNVLGRDIISTLLFLLTTILLCIVLLIFGSNYLLPILCFLLSYLIIDKRFLNRVDMDTLSMFFITLISKIPVIAFCYYILTLFFVPHYY